MADSIEIKGTEFGCSPSIAFSETAECSLCAPKSAVTPEEESVLAEMRAIKEQVRTIAERLKKVEASMKGTFVQQSEWTELSGRLEDLRTQWKTWEDKLEEAIERKLVLLGHRDPKA
ncbi:MAG: hypothetical protein NTW27_04485 [Deltaproteobacteria bacterium]|nr:hypothetical protein [Deltaproteobacteria bacterium]